MVALTHGLDKYGTIIGMNTFDALLVIIVALLGIVAAVNLTFLFRFKSLHRQFSLFVQPAGPDEPSPAAQLVARVAETFAAATLAAAKNGFAGDKITNAHMERTVERAMATDVLNQRNPILGQILAQYPTLQRKLTSNPQLLPILLEKLGPLFRGGATQGVPNLPASPGSGRTGQFDLGV